jgi:UDP:flavonoid glycosyltransferase YjiC (YdhE family)
VADLTPDLLHRRLRSSLADLEEFSRNAEALAAQMAREDGVVAAVAVLEAEAAEARAAVGRAA